MDNPKVSIVINNYNYGQFIAEAIDSALNQSYQNVEVVVADDGSTDQSIELIRGYGDRILPVLKENGGQASSLNAGFLASHGDIIIFLDADDYLYPQTVERVVAHWQEDAAQLQYRLEIVDAVGNFIEFYPIREIPFDRGDVWKLLVNQGRYRATVTSGNSFSRLALEKVMPIPENDFRISADGYLVAVVPFFGQVVAVDEALGARRRHGSNLWSPQVAGWEEKLHKSLQHDDLRYRYIAQTATALGYPVQPNLGLRDYSHLMNRMGSLRMAPEYHPISNDSSLVLAWHGFWSTLKRSPLPPKRKLIVSLWFLWAGIMPKPLAKPAIAWLLANQSRPKSVDKLLKLVRAFSR